MISRRIALPFYPYEFVIHLISNYIPLRCLVDDSNYIPTFVVDGIYNRMELHPRHSSGYTKTPPKVYITRGRGF